jgi:hypothetical protein
MTPQELERLLERIEDTSEIVLGGIVARDLRKARDPEAYCVWEAARAEARRAYDAWRTTRTRRAYAAYRAAADRADAAQDVLAAAAAPRP